MMALGVGANGAPGEIAAGFRRGLLRYVRIGLTSAGGAALVLAAFTLLQQRPAEGFQLLTVWGPWPVVAIVALALLAPFFSRLSDIISTSFTSIVASTRQTADAQTKMANATSELAQQGKRQFEEVERMAVFAAREFPSVYERFDQQDQVLQDLTKSVARLHARLDTEEGQQGHGE